MSPFNLNQTTVPGDPLDRLRTLLLDPEHRQLIEVKKEINRLQLQFSDKDKLTELIEPVLAEALERKIFESRDEMAEVLAPVMGDAIKKKIKEAKEDIVDALYPVIGATIRKSIAEAMRNLTRSVNEKLNQAMSFTLFLNKAKARLRGMDSNELILKESLPFHLQEIFVIHKNSGVLINHLSNSSQNNSADADVIGSMFSAIKDFAQDAFKDEQEKELSEIQYHDLTIVIEPSRYFYMAAVVSRVPDSEFYAQINKIGARLHNRFYKKLRDFHGDADSLDGIKSVLLPLMQQYSPLLESKEEKPQSKKGLIFASLLLIVIIFFAGKQLFFSKEAITNIPVPEKINVEFDQHKLLREIRAAFGGKQIDLPGIKFIVDGSTLTLTGSVPSQAEKLLAVNAAAQQTNFLKIINNLQIIDASIANKNILNIEQIQKTLIHFSAHSTEPSADAQKTLIDLGEVLQETQFSKLIITGYSDNSGAAHNNLQISVQRAQNVAAFLSLHGIDKNKLIIEGKGEANPLAQNNTAQGRTANRRVEFTVIQ